MAMEQEPGHAAAEIREIFRNPASIKAKPKEPIRTLASIASYFTPEIMEGHLGEEVIVEEEHPVMKEIRARFNQESTQKHL